MDGSKTFKITIKIGGKASWKNKTLTWVTNGNMTKETGKMRPPIITDSKNEKGPCGFISHLVNGTNHRDTGKTRQRPI